MPKKLSDYPRLMRLSDALEATGLGRPALAALREQHPDLCVQVDRQVRYRRLKLQQICEPAEPNS